MNDAQRQAIKRRQRAMVGVDPDESEEGPPPAPAPAPLRPMEEVAAELRPDVGEGIPVKWVRFTNKTFQLPGMQSGEDYKTHIEPNGRVHRLELVKFGDMTCFLQTFIDPAKRDVKFTFIERSSVTTWQLA